MKLRYSPTSPFVRKVLVTLVETGLDDDVEKILTNIWNPESPHRKENPLGKIPVLITDDGTRLYDSPVICEYLDSLHDGEKLFPASGEARWRALTLQALGDGMAEAAVLIYMENHRPKEARHDEWIASQETVIRNSMDALEAEWGRLDGAINIGTVSVACMIGWLEFRFPDFLWRDERPGLAAWYDEFANHPSMAATAPRNLPRSDWEGL